MIRKLFNKIMPVSDGIKKLGQQMIDNPLDWVQGKYEFTNNKNRDVKIWTSNGILYIKINGFNGLSLSDKIYINNCIKMSIANRLVQSVIKNMKVYYREFKDLTALNEWIEESVKKENVISINYINYKHCMYFWM